MFLLRGCDTLRVTLCPGVVGKELYHALRIAGTQARPQLRRIEFPCNILNRHSYGFAALQLGGKTLATLPDYCLSAGDFPLTSEEDFDNFGGSPDLKLEKKGRYPNTLTSWFRARFARVLGLCMHIWRGVLRASGKGSVTPVASGRAAQLWPGRRQLSTVPGRSFGQGSAKKPES